MLASCSVAPEPDAAFPEHEPVIVREASGVHYRDGSIHIVDDSVHDAYFEIQVGEGSGPVISINDAHPVRKPLPVGIWIDLEAIEELADGRIVVLSERLRGLVSEDGPVVQYDYQLSEFGRRGLEGIAVRSLPDGSSRIAVLWEGGYPDVGSLHPQIAEKAGAQPLLPLFYVHDLAAGETVERARWGEGLHKGELHVPKPAGEEPEAQRFRAPDLVWYRFPNGQSGEWGFLVLISSQNAVEQPEYLHHWLLKFDIEGQPAGQPLDLAEWMPENIAYANWEGLDWIEEGRSLILVHEAGGDNGPNAYILELPEAWRYEAR